MNALEKALLVKELHQLLDGLEHRSLSFFEIAKSKTRLIEIFRLCDDPIFKKQILKFKSQTQPQQAATDFADQTPFKLSYRGLFRQDGTLQQALYQNTESGWAILYHPAQGWKIWLIPAPNRSALISVWGNLAEIYQWMLEQQQRYSCLKTDDELRQKAVLLERHLAPILTQTETHLNLSPPLVPEQNQINVPDLSTSNQHLNNQLPHILKDKQQVITAKKQIGKDVLQSLQLGPYLAHLYPVDEKNAAAQELHGLEIPALPEISQYVDLLIHAADLKNWQQHPIYLAEQVDTQNCFMKYLVLFGAENKNQAVDLMHRFTQHYQHRIVAIKQISWEDLAENFTDFEALFYSYTEKAALLWKNENYVAFIPAQLFQTQKIIQFKEIPADFKTPLLLLKERQKIRVIHGQNRLNLSRTELAYPYFLLERDQGVSWQLIQNIITQLESPIDCNQLYEAIQKHISD
ncbi:hypothetical protein E0H80_13675 [Acinetobacter sp. ANC 4779]|uniref:hypothetical protein n=1 Tax=Acinetobacter sp. ANC 4779 TaxID=2529848 RepID=UPI001040BA7B|nr:hypothetical protein [Acinetobacter sp. ANC 4779]TCB49024.1 hypothetical protein E0H80_13675 [Acinetobacter sp. ANC 4779]